MKFRTAIALTAFAAMTAGTASASTIASDDFSYSDGDITDNAAWGAHSGAASTPIQVTSGAAVLSHGGGSREDVNFTFAAQDEGTLTATFDLVVTDDPFGTGTDFEYFAHFMSSGGTFTSRLDVVAPNGASGYSLGVATTSSTAESTLSVDFAFGAVVAVELSYDFDTGLSSLTVGSDTVAGTSVGTAASLNQFALRQSNSSNDETITVDNLVITQVPEPGSLALLGLGGMLLARRRRSA